MEEEEYELAKENRATIVKEWSDAISTLTMYSKIQEIADVFPDKDTILIDYSDIDRASESLADLILQHPRLAISTGKEAILEELPPESQNISINIEIINIPETNQRMVRHLRAEDCNTMISVPGVITKISQVKPQVTVAVFECVRCGHEFEIIQDDIYFNLPMECPKPEGGCGRSVGTTKFKHLRNKSEYLDVQVAELQENPDEIPTTDMPQSLQIRMLGKHLTGRLFPGDRVRLTGIYETHPVKKNSSILDVFLELVAIEKCEREYHEVNFTNEDRENIIELSKSPDLFDMLIDSVAPTIFGLREVKEGILYQQFGGLFKEFEDGTTRRGYLHTLLIGDPGIAKSELLRYVKVTTPGAILTSGKSASAPGLTVTAEKDKDGRWSLTAGAVVLANGSICCIDEFTNLDKEEQEALKPPMEQGKLPINKAGINAVLNAKTSILASANPKMGRFERHHSESIVEQINITPPVLSGFDMIFMMFDKPNKEKDTQLSKHILIIQKLGQLMMKKDCGTPLSKAEKKFYETHNQMAEPPVSHDLMRKYIAYSKKNIIPVFLDESWEVISGFYTEIRSQAYNKDEQDMTISITPRQIETIIRLSEASARIRLSNQISVLDVDNAIRIMKGWLSKIASVEDGYFDIDIIATGNPKDMRDRIYILEMLIKNSAQDGGIHKDEIIREMEDRGIKAHQTETDLKKLRKDGVIYEPQHDVFRHSRY